jgi:hypothetical protein
VTLFQRHFAGHLLPTAQPTLELCPCAAEASEISFIHARGKTLFSSATKKMIFLGNKNIIFQGN